MVGWPFLLEGSSPVLEEFLLSAVEDRRLESHFIAQLRDRLLLQQVPPQDGDFLFRRVCFRCFFMHSLRWPNGGTPSPFPIEPEHGAATLVGMHNINDLFGLAFDSSTNTLYGTQFSSSRGFYTLTQSHGAATFIATIGVGIGGLKYNSADNELVGTNDGSGKIHHQSPPGHRRYWQALDSLLTAMSMTQAQTCIITLSDGNFYAIDTSIFTQ